MSAVLEDVLHGIWDELEPFRADILTRVPNASAVKYRGFNPQSVNNPENEGDIDLWVALNMRNVENPELVEQHKELLLKVWKELMELFKGDLDYVAIVAQEGITDVPGIYPRALSINDDHPFYQPA